MSKIIRLIDRTRTVQDWLPTTLGREIDSKFRDRFWSKVNILGLDDCWEWKSFINRKGYGQFQIRHKRPAHAHKVALALHKGLKVGKLACHTCDNRRCCNPFHLYAGTPKSNMNDMIRKGRQLHPSMAGEKNGHATITDEDVRYIRKWYRKIPTRDLAAQLGCSLDVIWQVGKGRTWKHVK